MITANEQFDWMLEHTEILERNLHADPAHTGLLRVVDRGYRIAAGDVIDVRFNV